MKKKLTFDNNDMGCVIRKPLFSYDILFSSDNATCNLDDVVDVLLKNDEFVSSIYWSSSEVYDLIQLYKDGLLKDEHKIKLTNTLKKYAIRISTRTTPFGTFSGCSYNSNVEIANKGTYRRARIDMDLLQKIVLKIEDDKFINRNLRYTLNNTFYKISNEYRYLEKISKNNKLFFQLSSIEVSSYVAKLLNSLNNKFLTLSEITFLFDKDLHEEHIVQFILGLIDENVLISELQYIVKSGADIKYIEKFLQNTGNVDKASKYVNFLTSFDECLKIIENTEIGYLPVFQINKVNSCLSELDIKCKQLFHIDLYLGSHSEKIIDKHLVSQLNETIYFLTKISSNNIVDSQLQQFKSLFKTKYEAKEVLLAEVLDKDFGLGFPPNQSIGNHYEGELFDNELFRNDRKEKVRRDDFADWIFEEFESRDNPFSIDVSEKKIDIESEIEGAINSNCLSVLGTFCENDFFFLQNFVGANAPSLLGRFGYLSNDLENLCGEISAIELEANREIIFAEVRHLPDGKTGNIAQQLDFYKYEIPIYNSGNLRVENQISLNDILVSIRNDEIVLWSKKFNKRILPRLSNAHNFNISDLPIYKFLASLQFENNLGGGINLNYGNLKRRFIPRITYKRIIIHRATWVLLQFDIEKIINSINPLKNLEALLKKINIKKFVVLIRGDNELFLDTSNDSYLKILLSELKNSKIIVLSEWLQSTKLIEGQSNFIKQILLPLKNKDTYLFNDFRREKNHKINRTFIPGSEWLYVKIYCSSLISDFILINCIFPLLRKWKRVDFISKGFFIRYEDPHYHLRFRVLLKDKGNFQSLFHELTRVLEKEIKKKRVWNVVLDTYEREVERYGIESIEDSETLFYYDSLHILRKLKVDDLYLDEDKKIFSAIKDIDFYLSYFDFTLKEKMQFCKEMESAFEKEFTAKMKKHIYSQYREKEKKFNLFMKEDENHHFSKKEASEILLLSLKIENLPSYIHMSINRWFSSQQRAYEYLCYIFAQKYFNRIANLKYNASSTY